MNVALLEGNSGACPRRVLVVVELGANWGHLLRMRPVLHELRARGHDLLLAVSDVDAAERLLGAEGFAIAKYPGALRSRGRAIREEINFYAQILDRFVFGEPPVLAESVRQWGKLLSRWAPEVILADFAPSALLAAHLHQIPLVQLVTGWEAPPEGETLPVTRPWRPQDPGQIAAFEAALVARLNVWCDHFGVTRYEKLFDLYSRSTQLLASMPETDHFAPRMTACYIGPIASMDFGPRVDWPEVDDKLEDAKKVVVYLAADSRNALIMQALRNLSVCVVAVLPGVAEPDAAKWRSDRIAVHQEAVQLKPLLEGAELVIHNAGHGTAAMALLAGVPVLTLPQTVEQALLTRRMQSATGAVRSMLEEGGVPNCQRTIHLMLHDPAIRASAKRVARRYAGSTQLRSVLAAVEAVEGAATSSNRSLGDTQTVSA